MLRRRRVQQTTSLQERLAEFARTIREKAESLPDGKERDELLKRLRSADTASTLDRQFTGKD
ncbi:MULTISPECIES: hypothetical protein [Bradyrhizobium]|uniref:hypothetical protein n=1 Tax=Bradyrhizobium TaxID=374 RepID=UPI001B8A188E|nr:hypothetical protein [Bradyrhizobium sp. Bra78]MBR0970464.1 hypothetical protein [Bradyrhizobium japonicum]